mgnify:CR=1 FL=1
MTDPLTAWLKAVKTRLTKATPRPWISKWSGYRGVYDSRGLRIFDITTNTPDEDAQFIVHAPTDLARAVALVEAAKGMEQALTRCAEGAFLVAQRKELRSVAKDALTRWHAAVERINNP